MFCIVIEMLYQSLYLWFIEKMQNNNIREVYSLSNTMLGTPVQFVLFFRSKGNCKIKKSIPKCPYLWLFLITQICNWVAIHNYNI